jgi:hypothetical protein
MLSGVDLKNIAAKTKTATLIIAIRNGNPSVSK